jgi:tetratricopeptide (TPR) repeat protein
MKQTGAEENKVDEAKTLLKQAFDCRSYDLHKSIALAQRVVTISEEIDDPELSALAKNQLALYLMIRGDYNKVLSLAEEALKFFDTHQNMKGIADAKYAIAGVHYKTDNFHLGLVYLLDCLFIYRNLGDHYNEARVLKSLGTIYEYLDDQENAISSYLSSVAAGRLTNDPNL